MTALERFATDCEFSILAIVLEDPERIDGLDLQADEFLHGDCARLWQCLREHRTNSEALIAEVVSEDAADLARDLKTKVICASSNLHRHIRGLRRVKETAEYARMVRAKLGRVRR